MIYLKVEWLHHNQAYPVLLYSELDEQRWEIRKAEAFPDGTWSYADRQDNVGDSHLGECPLPSIEEIGSSPEFRPHLISKEEFESAWKTATQRVVPQPIAKELGHPQIPLRRV